MVNPILYLILTLLDLYEWIVIIWIIVSWLVHFQIINTYHPFVNKLNYFLYRLTEPVLVHIRKWVPPIGGLDISPIVLFILLNFVQYTLHYYFM